MQEVWLDYVLGTMAWTKNNAVTLANLIDHRPGFIPGVKHVLRLASSISSFRLRLRVGGK
ncbi:hypothetical protein DF3PA_200028 [Candidatus Defluviicoccus seviourii]|uniref:Uncharacterized protein n=1 Tax=Candidatus Defluviicoccus seviourii TaxID=2565273 RepID=A0A564WCZ6_9PROT|nr:hypothetical protein DF3PA_200028 [Candidatus Defluviicoccus seviourii]